MAEVYLNVLMRVARGYALQSQLSLGVKISFTHREQHPGATCLSAKRCLLCVGSRSVFKVIKIDGYHIRIIRPVCFLAALHLAFLIVWWTCCMLLTVKLHFSILPLIWDSSISECLTVWTSAGWCIWETVFPIKCISMCFEIFVWTWNNMYSIKRAKKQEFCLVFRWGGGVDKILLCLLSEREVSFFLYFRICLRHQLQFIHLNMINWCILWTMWFVWCFLFGESLLGWKNFQ